MVSVENSLVKGNVALVRASVAEISDQEMVPVKFDNCIIQENGISIFPQRRSNTSTVIKWLCDKGVNRRWIDLMKTRGLLRVKHTDNYSFNLLLSDI
jgi:hypothetical protein